MAPNLPKTYKAAIFKEANGPLTLEDVELKMPEEGLVLVKVIAVGVCHSDAMVQAAAMNTLPRIPGHEIIGDVVALGPTEKKWNVGDRVGGAWHGGHDGVCKSCMRGNFVMCDNQAINGVSRDGGYAEYVLLRTEAVVPVPTSLDPAKSAPLLCAGVTVFAGMRSLQIPPGEVVAIQGLGGLGHLAVQYAAKMGYKVVALSSSGRKESFAKGLGAHVYVDGSKEDHAEVLQKHGGAAMIVITAPDLEGIKGLVGGLAKGGKMLVLGVAGDVVIPSVPMILKTLSIHGWPSGTPANTEDAIDFAQLKGVECQVTTYPLSKAQEAFDAMSSGKVHGRAVIVMDQK